MKFHFSGDIDRVRDGLNILSADYGFEISDDGICVAVSKAQSLHISYDGNAAQLSYHKPCEFFRALGILLEKLSTGNDAFCVSEQANFDTCGAMIDLSHGALMRVDAIKSVLRKMAIMGMDMLMLYREESYYLEGYEYFGYMRGRHTDSEIKELDDYAWQLGIEIIPAIQTIGHLSNTLRWREFSSVKDTADCLLVGEEETYQFIERMIKAAVGPLRSKRINIGFDETMSLGMGNYILKHGYVPRNQIFCEHLQRVAEIVKKMGLEPMVWSDMFFRSKGSTEGYALDTYDIPPEIAQKIPENIQLVEANYSTIDTQTLCQRIRAHLDTGRETWFAGAIHDWHGFCVNYYHTIRATNAALTACKQVGIKNVIATTWGDDSTERDFFCNLLGFQLYAEHMYNDSPEFERVKARFDFCGRCSSEMILDIAEIDNPEHILPESLHDEKTSIILDKAACMTNPSKYLMWQDPLAGLFDYEAAKLDFKTHFRQCRERLCKYKGRYPEYERMLKFYICLCDVLEDKSVLGLRLKKAYDEKNLQELKQIADKDIPVLLEKLEQMWMANRELWFKRHGPFGFDVLERRYGCLQLRLKTAAYRVKEYTSGRIGSMEELEEKRLPVAIQNGHVGYFNDYLLTSTAWGR